MNEDVKKYVDLGNYEFECDNFASAYDYYKKGIELDSENAYLWYKRSLAALRLDNLQEFSTGFEKARSLSDGDLYSEIESTFILEMILVNWQALESTYQAANVRAYDPMTELLKFNAGKECEKILHRILDFRSQLRRDNKFLLINDSDAIKVMKSIYKILIDIEKFRGAFGKYEIFWRKEVGNFVVPYVDNTAAWLNAKIGKNEFDGLASLIIMAQRRLP